MGILRIYRNERIYSETFRIENSKTNLEGNKTFAKIRQRSLRWFRDLRKILVQKFRSELCRQRNFTKIPVRFAPDKAEKLLLHLVLSGVSGTQELPASSLHSVTGRVEDGGHRGVDKLVLLLLIVRQLSRVGQSRSRRLEVLKTAALLFTKHSHCKGSRDSRVLQTCSGW